MISLSVSGTFRMILVLVALWLVMRWFMRMQAGHRSAASSAQGRPKGDVRVENAPSHEGIRMDDDRVVDADFEEIK